MEWSIYKKKLTALDERDVIALEDLAALTTTLARRRKEKQITRKQLATLSGVAIPSIVRVEQSASVMPRLDTVIKIARALDCRIIVAS
jgi:predicted transcriptional regulator